MHKYAKLHLHLGMDFMTQVEAIKDKSSFSIKPSPSKWSKNEILGHLVDSAYNNHQRLVRAKTQGNLIFQGYDQDDWVIQNNYQSRTFNSIQGSWLMANQHLNSLIANLSVDYLERLTTDHNFNQICMNKLPKGQPASLAYLVLDYCFHLEHHISQILPNYKKLGGQFGGFSPN